MSRLFARFIKREIKPAFETYEENPWAGLSSYEDPIESGKGLKFCGRNDESYDVTQLIVNNIFVTLYGKSGVGKTSLLNAGIFPRLRDKYYMPLSIRLSMDAVDMSFQECIIKKINQGIAKIGCKKTMDIVPSSVNEKQPEYLWTYFANTKFTAENGHVLFPVIVLDQFEEVLRTRKEETEVLLYQINYLMNESHALSNRFIDGTLYRYDFNFRFVVSIREDDLYRLEDSIDNNYLSEMKRTRFRLCSLTKEGVSDVILIPGSELIDYNERREIVDTIVDIAKNEDDNSINTNLLSLICYRIYVEYKKNNHNKISLGLVEKFISKNPFEQFYNEVISTLSEKEKSYIEEHLVDCMGRRDSVPESIFFSNVRSGKYLLTGATKILQLISVSSDPNNCRIELIHDSFCEPLVILKGKRRQRKRFFQMLAIILCLLVVIMGASWIINFMSSRHEKMLENQSRFIAEKASELVDEGDSYLASLLALEVLPTDLEKPHRPYTSEAEFALRKANNYESAILRGHTGFVTSLSYNYDGSLIATASYDKTVRIWDAYTGAELKTLYGHSDIVNSVNFSRDGKYAVSSSKDNVIMLWNIVEGMVVDTLLGHSKSVNSVCFSLDGKYIASSSDDKSIEIWDVEKGGAIHTLLGHSATVNNAVFTGDGKFIVSASDDKTVKVWDIEKEEIVASLIGHSDNVNSVCLSKDDKYLVSSSNDKTIKIWDFEKRKVLHTLDAHAIVESASFSPDSKYLVSSSWDNVLKIWDVTSGVLVDSLTGHLGTVTGSLFSPDGRKIISSSWDNTIRIWDTPYLTNSLLANDHKGNVISFSLSGVKGDRIVTSSENLIFIWDTKNGLVIDSLKGHTNVVKKVYFSPDGKRIASASWDKTIRIWDAINGDVIDTLQNHQDYVESVSYSSNGKKIVSSSWDNTVRVWDGVNGEELKVLDKHKDIVLSAVFSPNCKMIASCSKDSTIILWDADHYSQLKLLKGHSGPVVSIMFSPNNKYLASASTDKTVRIWDVESEVELHSLKGHTEGVTSVAFSPDGNFLVSTSNDNTIKVWNFTDGKLLQSIDKHSDDVNSAIFGFDGATILSASKDNTLRIWQFPSISNLIKDIKRRYENRKLSLEERKRYYID